MTRGVLNGLDDVLEMLGAFCFVYYYALDADSLLSLRLLEQTANPGGAVMTQVMLVSFCQ